MDRQTPILLIFTGSISNGISDPFDLGMCILSCPMLACGFVQIGKLWSLLSPALAAWLVFLCAMRSLFVSG